MISYILCLSLSLICLTEYSIISVFSSPPIIYLYKYQFMDLSILSQMGESSYPSWLNNILLCFFLSLSLSQTHHYLIIHRFTFRLLLYLAIMNNAEIKMDIQISLWYPVFTFFAYISRNGIARSYSTSNFLFIRLLICLFFLKKTYA